MYVLFTWKADVRKQNKKKRKKKDKKNIMAPVHEPSTILPMFKKAFLDYSC